MAITQKGEKMPERRLTRAGKLTRILIINGECLKEDLLEFAGSMNSIDNLLSVHSNEFTKITKQAEIEKKEEDDIHFDKLVLIRPKVTYKKIEASPFKKLVYKLDPSGAAWTYYDEKVFRVGKVRSRNRTIYRNTTISHFLIRIMDIFDIDVWARPTIQEICAENEYIPVNTFFTVNELKNFSATGNREHCNSVSLGILTTPQGVYSAYSMKTAPEESYWNIVQKKKKKRTEAEKRDEEKPQIPGYLVGVEERFQRHVTNVFRTGKYEYSSGSHNNILILGTEDIAVSICKGFYFPNSKKVIRLPKSAEKVTFLIDDHSSKEVLTLLSIPHMREKIRDEVAANIAGVWEPRDSKTEDAVMGGKDTLIWMDNDIRRLSRALNKKDRSPKQLMIVCLDSQKDLVEKIVEIYRNKEIEVFTAPIKYETALSMATKEREVIDDA